MIKYTLYATPGRGFYHPGLHLLKFGEWLEWMPTQVILKHGILTDEEFRQFKSQEFINIYQDHKCRQMDIFSYYDTYYQKRKGAENMGDYVGMLKKLRAGELYVGTVKVK